MSLVAERAGRVHVRVGGNTQETARMVTSLPDGKAIEKQKVDTNNPVRLLLRSPRRVQLIDAFGWIPPVLDTNAGAAVHARDLVFVVEHLVAGEREVVSWYTLERHFGHPVGNRTIRPADPGRQPHWATSRQRTRSLRTVRGQGKGVSERALIT